jgi:DNA-binding NarL/FixJ family response regulator
MMTIRVLIVEDQPLTRLSIQKMLNLEPDIDVVGLAENGKEAIDQMRLLIPDVVLMDVRMPIMDGKKATRQIMKEFPDCSILMLTTFDSDQYILEALKAGAKGYLLKDMDMRRLAEAIRMTHRGYSQMSPGILEKFVNRIKVGDRAGGKIPDAIPERQIEITEFNKLTSREQEILEAIGRELNDDEIAELLFISVSTIRSHISNMSSKLKIQDRSQLKSYADTIFENRYRTLA